MCGGGGGWRSDSSGPNSSSDGGSQFEGTGQQEADSRTVEDDPCLINQRTDLRNTNPDVLADLNVGDVLPIEIRDGHPCVVDHDGRVVGSILGDLGEMIMDCMEDGYRYRAEIIQINGRDCTVRITNKCLIDDEVMLSSLDPEVLSSVSEGDVLDVVVSDESLCVVDGSERVLGSIAKPWTKVLIECVESEVEYRSTVISIDGGECIVQVQNAPSDQ